MARERVRAARGSERASCKSDLRRRRVHRAPRSCTSPRLAAHETHRAAPIAVAVVVAIAGAAAYLALVARRARRASDRGARRRGYSALPSTSTRSTSSSPRAAARSAAFTSRIRTDSSRGRCDRVRRRSRSRSTRARSAISRSGSRSVRVGNSTVRFEIEEPRRVQHRADRTSLSSKHPSGADEPAGGDPQRLSIEEFAFAGGAIFLSQPRPRGGSASSCPTWSSKTSAASSGATGGELGAQIARAFTRRVAVATAGHQLGRAVERSSARPRAALRRRSCAKCSTERRTAL